MTSLPLLSNLDGLPVGVVVVSVSGRVAACNDDARALFEIGTDAIGRHVAELDLAPGVPDIAAAIAGVRETGAVRRLPDARVMRRAADPAIVVTSISPARDASGQVTGTIIAIQDCTRLRELEAAHHADEYKHDFLPMLAHELRNPLSPIVSALNVIRRRGGADETVQRAREVAERQVQHESRLIDDLLDAARITRGKVELRKTRLDVAVVIDHALESVRGLMAARQHSVVRSIAEAPLHVEADPVRLEQVIVNLLNNAATYTPPGGHIVVSLVRSDDHAQITVRDTGRGIPADMLAHVFDLFTQFHASIDRPLGGLGIGLAVVKSLVELHGGTVTATSDGLGHGSEFSVRLPLALARPAETGPGPAPAPLASPRHVLIVEDNADAREMLRTVLEMDGHQVEVADDGLAGVQLGIATQPEAALVDIGLPGIDGYEVARRLRQHLGDAVLLIALTGYGQPEDRRRSRQAGFDAHFTKPIDLAGLSATLARSPRAG
jgi:signal transduction histidine kinase/CheY-like chemotaxis protein